MNEVCVAAGSQRGFGVGLGTAPLAVGHHVEGEGFQLYLTLVTQASQEFKMLPEVQTQLRPRSSTVLGCWRCWRCWRLLFRWHMSTPE